MNFLSRTLLMLVLGAVFVASAVVGGPNDRAEVSIMRAMADARATWPGMAPWIVWLTNLGAAPVTLGVTAVASLLLLFRRAPARALLLALTVLIERSMVDGLKDWIGRPRPTYGVDWLPASLAYPSGHAANSMAAFLAAALIASPPAYRGRATIAALALSFIVGLSRIWLGVHWPSDVIGGWTLGLLAVGTALIIGERSGALEPQHQIVGRHVPPLGEDKAS